jgi:CDP-diacylglycerol--glycerol-3-phosphate 3-phosphatidyltransferase
MTISTYQLKTRFQSLLRPLAARLHRAGITANQITISACVISVALGTMTLFRPEHNYLFLLISLWLLLRMAANALDGILAREFDQASRLGAVLNEMGDMISDVALYLPFAWLAGSQPWLVAAIVVLAVCSELAGWLGAALANERANHGPMGKSDRALAFGVVALLIGCGVSLAPLINVLWLAILCLLLLTLFNRARHICATQNTRNML